MGASCRERAAVAPFVRVRRSQSQRVLVQLGRDGRRPTNPGLPGGIVEGAGDVRVRRVLRERKMNGP